MTNELGGILYTSSQISSLTRSEGRALTGQLNGDQIRLSAAPLSLFQSAAEEMSFARSTINSRDLKSRTISHRPFDIRVKVIEELRLRLEAAESLPEGEEFRPLLRQLLSLSDASSSQARHLASQHFADVSQQFMALKYLREWLKKQRAKRQDSALNALIDAVDSATEQLMAEQGAAVSAGINVLPVASSFASQGLGSVDGLRQFYRDAVLDYGSLADTFKMIIQRYGEDDLPASMHYLVKALGADLASEGPSMPKARLMMIIEDLHKIQSLEGLSDETRELLAQLERIYRGHSIPTRLQVMAELLELLDKTWVRAIHIDALGKSLTIPDHMTIFFFRGLKELIRLIPRKAFKEEFDRDNLLAAVQESLDERIEQEELGDERS